MSVSRLKFHIDELQPSHSSGPAALDVRLFGAAAFPGMAHIGNKVPDQIERLGVPTSNTAFDLLAIALAVTAADSFVPRSKTGENGWARQIEIELPLVSPQSWMPVRAKLERILNFLSGDTWNLRFASGGRGRPSALQTRKKRSANLTGVDSICLFSGGLDSWIGANELLGQGKIPLLVSHAYTGDRQYQNRVFPFLNGRAERFAANASPMRQFNGHDTTMRTRSFNFLAYAAVAADAVSQIRKVSGQIPVFVPENGFIALNAPLTPRRIGSLSTRTTHPYYLLELQTILDAVGINAIITNPYRHKTKGEMLASFNPSPAQIAAAMKTVSCGKWKRKGIQCGHCVPCIIRRAAFFASGIPDTTAYGHSIQDAIRNDNIHLRDDVSAMIIAAQPRAKAELRKRAMQSGPLPMDVTERQAWFDVNERGLYEVANYLRSEGLMS